MLNQSGVGLAAGRFTQPKLSLPATQQAEINGHTLLRVALDVYDLLSEPLTKLTDPDTAKPYERGLNYVDVHAFVVEQVQTANKFLAQPCAANLWDHCTPELAEAIRENRRWLEKGVYEHLLADEKAVPGALLLEPSSGRLRIYRARAAFFRDIKSHFPDAVDSTIASLAWHIIVESALLNQQLVKDMKELAATKNCPCLAIDWMPFYGPNPPPEARLVFNQYVECRWPIHVFALDPSTQDQNVGASYQRRREMQMVLAAAAATRMINIQHMTRFIRRLEYDLETIELNRTDVGFAHGEDTLGWRFYPRIQAPAVPGNLEACTRELLLGDMGRDSRIRTFRLEPGIRECEAVVVMPSFVPYVTVDFRSNWFRLADNRHGFGALRRELDVEEAVDLSREVTKLRKLTDDCRQESHRYRDGEAHRLTRIVDQLERQLPLQTSFVQVPYENTLGGFEMFNSGITDLAPELHGWYGAPGVRVSEQSAAAKDALAAAKATAARAALAYQAVADGRQKGLPDADVNKLIDAATKAKGDADSAAQYAGAAMSTLGAGTTLFLVGKNFSTLDTQVMAGGQAVLDTKLISRQVMQVTIPAGVTTVKIRDVNHVDVHLATPYGVTSHLHIPVANTSEKVTLTPALSQDVIKKAVDEHLKAKHPLVFQWAPNSADAQLMIYGGQVAPLDLKKPLLIEVKDASDVPFQPSCAELRCFVYAKPKGKDRVRIGATEGISLLFLPGVKPTTLNQYSADGAQVKTAIDAVLSMPDRPVPRDAEALEIDGYLRTGANPGVGGDGLPVYRLEGPLTIKLDVIDCPCPATCVPPAPTGGSSVWPALPTNPQAAPDVIAISTSPAPPKGDQPIPQLRLRTPETIFRGEQRGSQFESAEFFVPAR